MGALGITALTEDITKGPKTTSDGEADHSFEFVPPNAGITEEVTEKGKKSSE